MARIDAACMHSAFMYRDIHAQWHACEHPSDIDVSGSNGSCNSNGSGSNGNNDRDQGLSGRVVSTILFVYKNMTPREPTYALNQRRHSYPQSSFEHSHTHTRGTPAPDPPPRNAIHHTTPPPGRRPTAQGGVHYAGGGVHYFGAVSTILEGWCPLFWGVVPTMLGGCVHYVGGGGVH